MTITSNCSVIATLSVAAGFSWPGDGVPAEAGTYT
jgi:hypothetical protein